jgi:hypothetical protein
MVKQAWLNDGETIISNSFVESHIKGKCIPIEKIKEAINKFSFKQDGFIYLNVTRLKNELGLE